MEATPPLRVTNQAKQGLPPARRREAVFSGVYCGRRLAFAVGVKCDRHRAGFSDISVSSLSPPR